jgi:5-methylcytosine-specific restriction endonuclease McrA
MTNKKTLKQLAEEKKEYRKTDAYKKYLEQSREKRKLYKRELRKRNGIKTIEEKKILQHIKNIRKPLSVLDLVNLEQRNYWIEKRKTQKGKAEYTKYLYDTLITYRLMMKEKRQRNKFIEANLYVEKISQKQFMARCAVFNFCCAYCNKPTEMDTELEHVIPRSKGGSHCLANIVPACRKCNQSKYNYPMEKWYKDQPFYSGERLKKIKKVLNQTPYPVKQTNLFPEWMVIPIN